MDWDSKSVLYSRPSRHKRRCNAKWKKNDRRHCALCNNSVQHKPILAPAAKSIAGAGDSVKKASDSLFSTEKALRQLISAVTDATTDLNDRQIQTLDRYQAIYKLLQQHVLKQEHNPRMKTTPFGFSYSDLATDLMIRIYACDAHHGHDSKEPPKPKLRQLQITSKLEIILGEKSKLADSINVAFKEDPTVQADPVTAQISIDEDALKFAENQALLQPKKVWSLSKPLHRDIFVPFGLTNS